VKVKLITTSSMAGKRRPIKSPRKNAGKKKQRNWGVYEREESAAGDNTTVFREQRRGASSEDVKKQKKKRPRTQGKTGKETWECFGVRRRRLEKKTRTFARKGSRGWKVSGSLLTNVAHVAAPSQV